MEDIILNFAKEHLYIHVLLIALSATAIIGAMIVDLIVGVHKAKQRGEATTSKGYKKTAKKGRKYFSPYAVLVFIDLICCALVPVPAFSMLWSAYCVFCEFISVREKAWEKAEILKAEKTMSVIIENKDDIAKLVATLISQTDSIKHE